MMLNQTLKIKPSIDLFCICLSLIICHSVQAEVNIIDVNKIVEKAVDKHPSVLSAKSEAKATDEGITAAKLRRFPEVSVESGMGSNNPTATVTLQQPLWTWGKIDSTIDQATYDSYAAKANVESERYNIAIRALDAWQAFVIASNNKSVYADTLSELNRFEQMMNRRVRAQVSAKIELELVLNRILQSQDAYEGANQQQRIALSRLQQITGEPISNNALEQTFNLTLLANKVRTESASFHESKIFSASEKHPTVIKSKYEMLAAQSEADVARAESLPQLYAKYSHQYNLESNESNNDFLIGFQYAPGAGFSSHALARASEQKVSSIFQNQEAAKRKVIEDLQVDYQQFASARNRERSLIYAVEGAQIVKNSYERQFITGRKSWLDVLNAVRELEQYEIQLVEARVNFVTSYYRLKLGLGLLPWQGSVVRG